MQIIQKKLSEIVPYEKNPRKNDGAVDYVANSIKEFGFKVPIVIDKDGVIVAGHTRYKASRKLHLETVPCIVADDLTDEQIKAYRLADNKVSEQAEWDDDLLKLELDDIFNIDMEGFGFDLNIGMDEDVEVEEDDFEMDVPEEPKAKLGDIYKLGNHRLMCGDSTSRDDVENLLDGNKIYMIYTDAPYGMNLDTDYSGMVNKLDFAKEKNFKGGKKYEQGKVDEFHPEMVEAVLNIDSKECFMWGADYFSELIPDRNKGSWIVWDKRANENGSIEDDYSSDKMYGSCFELCWSKNRHKRDIARVKWAGVFGTEQEFDHKRHHPTQKPIKLTEWFLDRYSKKDDKILDLFGGSGSTLLGCEQMGRRCFMMEFDAHYVDVIIARWESLTGQKAELIHERDNGNN